MKDNTVKLSMQAAAAEMARRFPGRGFALFVFPGEPGEQAHYASNADRKLVIKACRELADAGMPGLQNEREN